MTLSAAINHNEQLETLIYIDYVCQCCQVVYVHGYRWFTHNINGHPHLSGYPLDFKVDGNLEQQFHDIAWIWYGEAMRYSWVTCVHVTGPFANW